MSQSNRPRRNRHNHTSSQPAVSSTSLHRQAQARDRARAGARTSLTSQAIPEQREGGTERAQTQQALTNPSNSVPAESEENLNCPLCALLVHDGGTGLMCEKCNTWFHPEFYTSRKQSMTPLLKALRAGIVTIASQY